MVRRTPRGGRGRPAAHGMPPPRLAEPSACAPWWRRCSAAGRWRSSARASARCTRGWRATCRYRLRREDWQLRLPRRHCRLRFAAVGAARAPGLVGGGGGGGFPRLRPGAPFSEWFEENRHRPPALSRIVPTASAIQVGGQVPPRLPARPRRERVRRVLLEDPRVTLCRLCVENFILWVGELHTAEGRAVRRALRCSSSRRSSCSLRRSGGGGGLGGGCGAPGDPAAVRRSAPCGSARSTRRA